MYPFQSFCQRYARLCKKGLRRFLEFIVLIKVNQQIIDFWKSTKRTNRKILFLLLKIFEILWHLAAGMTKTTFRYCFIFILGAGRSIGSYLFTRRISEQLDLSLATQGQDPNWVDFESWDRKTKISADFGLFVQVHSQLLLILRAG